MSGGGSYHRGISSTLPHQQQPAESVGGVHRDDSAGSYDLPSGDNGGVFATVPEGFDDEHRLISGEWMARPGEVDREEEGPPSSDEEEEPVESEILRGVVGIDRAQRRMAGGMQHRQRQQSRRLGPSTTLAAREDMEVGGQLNYLALSMMQVKGWMLIVECPQCPNFLKLHI